LRLNRFYTTALAAFLIGCGHFSSAQSILSTKSKKAIAYYQEADNYRVRRQYDQAISLLNEAIKKDGKFVEAYIRLGKIYHAIDQLELAEENYRQAIQLAVVSTINPDTYLLIAEVQITLEKYLEVKGNIDIFLTREKVGLKKKVRATLLKRQAEYALAHIDKPLNFNPIALNDQVNQFALQYFPAITADQQTLFYTKRNGNSPYDDEDIMVSIKNDQNEWGAPQSISDKINSELNEGTCTISANGRMMVFTSCQGRKGYGSCDLFVSHKVGDKWSEPENMGDKINSIAWESQPSLSSDGRKLYFVSNRKGGKGGRDIWVSQLVEGSWSAPTNLGNNVNTIFEEVSPFIHQNGQTLYYASNGKPGFGGFDIYSSELIKQEWSFSKNLGFPINRGNDQMSMIITADGSKGYYSDSGGDQERQSEIRQFDVPVQIRVEHKSYYVKGQVIDRETGESLSSKIQLYDLSSNQLVGQTASDSVQGDYLMTLTEGGKYGLYVNRVGYVMKSLTFDMSNTDQENSVIINVSLDRIKSGATTVLNNIFFEHDSYDLSKESLTELEKVAEFIMQNEITMEIGGYTDATGSEEYNMQLSIKRAQSVHDYLIKEFDIPQSRVEYRGYGVSKNDKSIPDSGKRRIEFKILHTYK